jgi:septal ring factor EnvC (AmiA/AmiB activator)
MNKCFSTVVLGVAFLLSGLIFSSCSNKITEEQLMQLRELRKQQSSLTESINKKKDEKSRLERELNARKAELKDCQEKTQFVKDKLAKWPDIWPDWKYVEPTPESAPTKEAPTKKIRKK